MQSTRSLHQIARELDLPASWLRQQAETGTIPSVVISRRRYFSPQAVEAAIERMASEPGKQTANGVDCT